MRKSNESKFNRQSERPFQKKRVAEFNRNGIRIEKERPAKFTRVRDDG